MTSGRSMYFCTTHRLCRSSSAPDACALTCARRSSRRVTHAIPRPRLFPAGFAIHTFAHPSMDACAFRASSLSSTRRHSSSVAGLGGFERAGLVVPGDPNASTSPISDSSADDDSNEAHSASLSAGSSTASSSPPKAVSASSYSIRCRHTRNARSTSRADGAPRVGVSSSRSARRTRDCASVHLKSTSNARVSSDSAARS